MAVFDFRVPIYGFDQWTGAATNDTVDYPVGTTFSLNAGATLVVIDVQDDDGNPVGSAANEFSDGFIDTPGNGSPPSTANNDQLLSQAITVNGQSFSVGDQVELEFAFTTTTGETFWVIRIDGVNVGISGPVLPVPGTTYQVASSGDGQATPVTNVPCFTDGALVATPHGDRSIETLQAGDLVMTLDRGAQPIVWAGAFTPSLLEFQFFSCLRPITITRDAFGPGQPQRDMIVSPQHRFLIKSDLAALLFGEDEVLAPAINLVNGVSVRWTLTPSPVTYRHLLLEKHELLIVDGTATESLYPDHPHFGPESSLHGELFGLQETAAHDLVRPMLRRFEAQLLARANPALLSAL